MRLVLGQRVFIRALPSRQVAYIRRLLMQQPASLFHEIFFLKREFVSFLIEVCTSQDFLESVKVSVCGHSLGLSFNLLVP
jgi:hypothetical protein